MNTLRLLVQFWICLGIIGMALYFYVDQKNEVMRLRMEIPILEKEFKEAVEENKRLKYEIERWQSPEKLFELLLDPRYAPLKYPTLDQVVILRGGDGEE